MSEELKMEDFWKYLDNGEYRKCHKLLDIFAEQGYNISDISTKRVVLLCRELKFKEAYEFAIQRENKCSNYVQGYAAFKHPRDIKIEEYKEKYISVAIKNFELSLKNNELGFLNKLSAQVMLIEAYLWVDKKKEAFYLAESIVVHASEFADLSPVYDGKYQVFLVDAFNPNNSEKKEEKLKYFFEVSKQERYKTFSDIIKFSSLLDYKPDDLLTSFSDSAFSDEDGYLYYKLIEETSDEAEAKKLKDIWFWQYLILSQLLVTPESKIENISHYTSQSTLELLLTDNKSKIAEFSLSNANDRVEGNVLPELLMANNVIDKNVNSKNTNPYIAVQTSYSRNRNSLTMFRLYGKKEYKEGTGISLVFNKCFFQMDPLLIKDNEQKDYSSFISQIDSTKVKDKRKPLFWVLYYNQTRNILYFYPSEDELKPYIIELNKKDNLKWNTFSNCTDITEMKQSNLLYSFNHLLKAISKVNNKDLAIKVLYKLRYFIKASDFSEEKELRMLELCKPGILKDNNFKLYNEYMNVFNYDALESIIIGPKVENKMCYYEYLNNKLHSKHSDITIKLSNAPLA